MPRIPVALTAVLASGSLLLCGCGDLGAADAPPPGAAQPAGDGEAPRMTVQFLNAKPRAALKQGGTLNWGIDQLSSQWNPLHVDGGESATDDVMKALLPTFWRSDAGGTQTPNPAYLVSARAETRNGHQVVTWTLNPRAHWSDGEPITWRDLAATWQALRGKDQAYKTSTTTGFDQVLDVKPGKDDYEAVMTFSTPFSEWQSMFNNAANTPLLPAKYIGTAEGFNTAFLNRIPVTAGPFKLQAIDPGAKTVTVVADPGWWGDPALLDRIVFKAMDGSAMPDAFARGDLDFFNNGPNTAGYRKIRATPGAEVRRAGGPNLRHLVLNGRSPQLTDPRVRQAIFQAIDRAAVTRSDLAGLDWPDTPMDNHFLVPDQNGYRDNSNGLSRYDPAAAAHTLDAAGWQLENGVRTKAGHQLALRFVIPASAPVAANEGAQVAAMLQKVGIKVSVLPVPGGDFFEKYVYQHDFDLTAFALLGTPFPASNSASGFQQNAGGNYAQVGSEALDAALADAESATDTATEYQAINRADAEAWQVAGEVPLYQRPAIYGARKTLANLGAPGLGDYVYENIGFQK